MITELLRIYLQSELHESLMSDVVDFREKILSYLMKDGDRPDDLLLGKIYTALGALVDIERVSKMSDEQLVDYFKARLTKMGAEDEVMDAFSKKFSEYIKK